MRSAAAAAVTAGPGDKGREMAGACAGDGDPDPADPADTGGGGAVCVGRSTFLALRHTRAMPAETACLARIRAATDAAERDRPRAAPVRGRGRRGRGSATPAGARGDRVPSASWADVKRQRPCAGGKRPLAAAADDDAASAERRLASACNKLSSGNYERIAPLVRALLAEAPDAERGARLADALFEKAVLSGSYTDLYVRLFRALLADPGHAELAGAAVSRAAARFAGCGATVMAYLDAEPSEYDRFCEHGRARRTRLATLTVLARLGVADAARAAVDAFERHMCGGAGGERALQDDLLVDGLDAVREHCPQLRERAHALATRAEAAGVADPRTRFKLLDVIEAGKRARRQRPPRRGA